MALNFPSGQPNGTVWTDPNGEQWVYNSAENSWTSKGLVNDSGGLKYNGGLNITQTPPTAESGDFWSVETGGTANAGFAPGLTGAIDAGSLVLYDGAGWVLINVSPYWTRSGGYIEPVVATDVVRGVSGAIFGPNANIKLNPDGSVETTGNLISPGAIFGSNSNVKVNPDGSIELTGNLTSLGRVTFSGTLKSESASSNGDKLLRLDSSQYDSTNEDEGCTAVFGQFTNDANTVNFGGGSSSRNAATELNFWTGASVSTRKGTKRMSVKPDGSVQFSSSISIGGTAAANTIDSYEEGTWTPTILSNTNSAQTAITASNGSYRKNGSVVTCYVELSYDTAGSINTSTFKLGLPFSGASGSAVFIQTNNLNGETIKGFEQSGSSMRCSLPPDVASGTKNYRGSFTLTIT